VRNGRGNRLLYFRTRTGNLRFPYAHREPRDEILINACCKHLTTIQNEILSPTFRMRLARRRIPPARRQCASRRVSSGLSTLSTLEALSRGRAPAPRTIHGPPRPHDPRPRASGGCGSAVSGGDDAGSGTQLRDAPRGVCVRPLPALLLVSSIFLESPRGARFRASQTWLHSAKVEKTGCSLPGRKAHCTPTARHASRQTSFTNRHMLKRQSAVSFT
jgi:hypothetical protein